MSASQPIESRYTFKHAINSLFILPPAADPSTYKYFDGDSNPCDMNSAMKKISE
jgi:hypothetical protein